ncbi:MAG: DUF433 domain-containing protein [Cyanobacteria bacterium P01_B01_bin.77]
MTLNPEIMGKKSCIQELRVTVGIIVALLAGGHSSVKFSRPIPTYEIEGI